MLFSPENMEKELKVVKKLRAAFLMDENGETVKYVRVPPSTPKPKPNPKSKPKPKPKARGKSQKENRAPKSKSLATTNQNSNSLLTSGRNCRVKLHNMSKQEIATKIKEVANSASQQVGIAQQNDSNSDWINHGDTVKIVIGEKTFIIAAGAVLSMLRLPFFESSNPYPIQSDMKMVMDGTVAKNDGIDCLIRLFSRNWFANNSKGKQQSNNQIEHSGTIKIFFGGRTFYIDPNVLRSLLFTVGNLIARSAQNQSNQLLLNTADNNNEEPKNQIEQNFEWINHSDTIKIGFGGTTFYIDPIEFRSSLSTVGNIIARSSQNQSNQLLPNTADSNNNIDCLNRLFSRNWFDSDDKIDINLVSSVVHMETGDFILNDVRTIWNLFFVDFFIIMIFHDFISKNNVRRKLVNLHQQPMNSIPTKAITMQMIHPVQYVKITLYLLLRN